MKKLREYVERFPNGVNQYNGEEMRQFAVFVEEDIEEWEAGEEEDEKGDFFIRRELEKLGGKEFKTVTFGRCYRFSATHYIGRDVCISEWESDWKD